MKTVFHFLPSSMRNMFGLMIDFVKELYFRLEAESFSVTDGTICSLMEKLPTSSCKHYAVTKSNVLINFEIRCQDEEKVLVHVEQQNAGNSLEQFL